MSNNVSFSADVFHGLEATTEESMAFVRGSGNVFADFGHANAVKELEAGCISHRIVDQHRRVLVADMLDYRQRTRHVGEAALQELADQAQDLGMGY